MDFCASINTEFNPKYRGSRAVTDIFSALLGAKAAAYPIVDRCPQKTALLDFIAC